MKYLLSLLLSACALAAQTNVQKGAGDALSNGNIVVGNNTSITATGSGSIAATSVPALAVNTASPLLGGGLLVANLTLSIPPANATTSGYLTSTDWASFNAKQPAGDYATNAAVNGYFADPSTNGSFSAPTWRSDLGLGSVALLNSVSLTSNVTGVLPTANGGTAAGDGNGTTGLRGVQQQRMVITPSTWTTVAELSGSGVLTKFWFALDRLLGSGDMRNALIRITANGAVTPQFGGSSGIPLTGLVGTGFLSAPIFRTDVIGLSRNQPMGFSGYSRVPMPFNNGLKIEIYVPNSVDSWAWIMAEHSVGKYNIGPLMRDQDWVLHAESVSVTSTPLQESTLFNISGASYLYGLWHYFDPGSGGQNFYYLEGDYRIYYDGSGTASYQASGAEDFYSGSYYFLEGTFATDDSGMVYKNTTNGRLSAYRFFDINAMPRGVSALRLSWQNGENYPGFIPSYNVTSNAYALYYKLSN